MPIDLDPGLPIASVDLGDGGAHDPQIKFSAPDSSCIWNGFNAELRTRAFLAGSAVDPPSTAQISSFTTPLPSGGAPSEAQWPRMLAYDSLDLVLSGWKLEGRLRFTTSGTVTVRITNPLTGAGWTYGSNVFAGDFDSGWVDLGGPDCTSFTCGGLVDVPYGPSFSPFSPFSADVITGGRLDGRWVPGGSAHIGPEPCLPFWIEWRPPGYVAQFVGDLDAGIYVNLASTSCGALFKTYNQVRDLVNASGLGIVASINHNGGDIAQPDAGELAGAICSGAIHNKTAAPL